MWIQFSLKCPEVKKLRGECLAERAWGLAVCTSFWKINRLFCQREDYLVPLLSHISNLIISGPISPCACKVDRGVEHIWKKASFIPSQGGLLCGRPRISAPSWGGFQPSDIVARRPSAPLPVASHLPPPTFFLLPTPQIIPFFMTT